MTMTTSVEVTSAAPVAERPSVRSDVFSCLTLIALPFLLIAINDSWIFTYMGSIDPWVYFGYFTNLRGHLRAFPGTYYGTRLSWIVPGALAHEILPPMAANYVLHLGVYYAAVFALYFTLARTVGRRAALLVSIWVGCYSYFLYAVGWHYVDGPGLAYYSVALACLTGAIDARRRRLVLVAAGAAFAAVVYTNMVWAIMLPAFGYYYLVTTWASADGRVLHDWAYVLLGSILVTVSLSVANVAYGGHWLFFLPSFQFGVGTVGKSNVWRTESWSWLLRTRWIVFPTVVFLSTLCGRLTHKAIETPILRLLADHYLGIVLIFVLFDLAGGALLQFPYYVSYLIPGMALAAGGQMRAVVCRLSRLQYITIAGFTLAVLTLTLAPSVALRVVPHAYGTSRLMVAPFLMLLTAVAVLRVSTNMLVLTTVLLCVGVVNVLVTDGEAVDFQRGSGRRDVYRATVAVGEVLTRLDPAATARFWYNETSPLGYIYRSIASTRLWRYRLVGTRFPSLTNPDSWPEATVAPGENIVVLAAEDDAFTQAEAALRTSGVGATLVNTREIAERGIRIRMLFVRTGVDRRQLAAAPLPVSTDVFVQGSEKGYAIRVAVDAKQDGVQITTNRSTYDWQLVSRPIPVTPSRRHLADFELRIPTGGAGFHVIATKTQTVLASRYWCEPVVTSTHQQLAFDTGSNDSVRFVLSNCGSPEPVISDFEVKRIQVWPYRSDVAGPRQ